MSGSVNLPEIKVIQIGRASTKVTTEEKKQEKKSYVDNALIRVSKFENFCLLFSKDSAQTMHNDSSIIKRFLDNITQRQDEESPIVWPKDL